MKAPLNVAELGTLKKLLQERRRVLRSEMKAKLSNHDDPALLGLANRLAETDDWAVADLETALEVAEVARDAVELKDVDAALTHMEDGTYGICADCAKPIPYARLEVNPGAQCCIGCQEKREATLPRQGHPSL